MWRVAFAIALAVAPELAACGPRALRPSAEIHDDSRNIQ
jgi:hypothetical protein